MGVSQETKDVLEMLRKEVMAAMWVFKQDHDAMINNDALGKVIRFIDQYKNGKGLFQLTNE